LDYLQKLFSPQSVAVIGASGKDGSLGKMFMDALTGMSYRGSIYPVNPKTETINGIRCFKTIRRLPATPDLAVILLPKDKVLNTLDELAEKGVVMVIVISAGFREVGEEGVAREQALIKRIKKRGMRLLGPNCMGIFNTSVNVSLNATFSPSPPIPGHIGFISQSGALGVAVLELCRARNLGFSCFASIGNKADINEADCLGFMAGDANTRSVIIYQESLDNPYELRKICASLVSRKPLLVLKAGRTESGLKAASSHTGALASDDRLTDAFLKQCGMIRCETLQELLDAAQAFESTKKMKGKGIAIVTNAGGPGILASDALEKQGFRLAELTQETQRILRDFLPPEASVSNPVDMIASATHDTYRLVVGHIERDPHVHAILVIIVKPPVDTTPAMITKALEPLLKHTEKYFAFTIMSAIDEDDGREQLAALKLPEYQTPESAARALGSVLRYHKVSERFRNSPPDLGRKFKPPAAPEKKRRQASAKEMFSLLDSSNLPVCPYLLTTDLNQALEFKASREKIVLKTANREILHKSELGLVKTGLSSAKEVRTAFAEIITRAVTVLPEGTTPLILVQEMIEEGVEFILGAKEDSRFGKVVMFGIGGIFVELYRDVAFRVLPVDLCDALQMIGELQGKRILQGFRHFEMIDQGELAQTIVDFADLIETHPEIAEMDLNPLIWSDKLKKPMVADSRCTIFTS